MATRSAKEIARIFRSFRNDVLRCASSAYALLLAAFSCVMSLLNFGRLHALVLLLVFVGACAHQPSRSERSQHRSQQSDFARADAEVEGDDAEFGDEFGEGPSLPSGDSYSARREVQPPNFRFRWPTKYPEILSYFGWRKRRMHEGLDLKGPTGTRIYAAASGVVIHAGKRLRGYGRTVVIEHAQGFSTVYAHLSKSKVKVGDRVRAGDMIGLSGRSGRTTGAHLHFEIRHQADPLDPLNYLPKVYGQN